MEPTVRPRQPIGFAHRGARSERRDNTIDAFRRALELGATGLESDAWITADGEAILDHDGTTGPRWRRKPISAQNRAQLPPHIPSLADFYQACGTDFELSLDVKDPAALGPILAVAATVGATSRLWLCHPDAGVLARWRAAAGTARLVESTRLRQIPEGLGRRADLWHRAGIDAVNLHRRDWSPAGVRAVHDAGLTAFGWDAQAASQVRRLLEVGIDGVYSDHVELMMREIRFGAGGAAPAGPPAAGSEETDARQGPDA